MRNRDILFIHLVLGLTALPVNAQEETLSPLREGVAPQTAGQNPAFSWETVPVGFHWVRST